MLETSARLLRLLSLLQTHSDWTGTELAERLGVGQRTIWNDVDRLRQLGYPVDARRGAFGGYRLGAGASLPPLLLDDDEAVAVVIGLTVSSSGGVTGVEETSLRALGKLEQVLPARLRRRVNALRTYALRVPPDQDGPRVASELLSILATACRDHEKLRICYRSHGGDVSRRIIEPHRLVAWGRRWYLVAWDEERDDWRTFRVDRIDRADPTTVLFRERPLPDPDITSYIARNVAQAGWTYRARFQVFASAEAVLERIDVPVGIVEPIDEGRCYLEVGSDDLWTMAVYIGLLGFDFSVDGAPALVDHLRVLADRYNRAVGGGNEDHSVRTGEEQVIDHGARDG